MSDEIQPVTLSDGTSIAAVRPRATRGPLAVRLLRASRVVDEVTLPYPRAGLAGGRLIVSPTERFVVLSMFSGQSEEGYELFRLADGITRVASLPYQFGEAASFCFSPDESVVVMALAFHSSEWWIPWEEGEGQPDGAGRLAFAFGQLRVHAIATNRISVHELRVSVAEAWQPARGEYDPDLHPRFVAERCLALNMPWGEVELSLPIGDTFTFSVDP